MGQGGRGGLESLDDGKPFGFTIKGGTVFIIDTNDESVGSGRGKHDGDDFPVCSDLYSSAGPGPVASDHLGKKGIRDFPVHPVPVDAQPQVFFDLHRGFGKPQGQLDTAQVPFLEFHGNVPGGSVDGGTLCHSGHGVDMCIDAAGNLFFQEFAQGAGTGGAAHEKKGVEIRARYIVTFQEVEGDIE